MLIKKAPTTVKGYEERLKKSFPIEFLRKFKKVIDALENRMLLDSYLYQPGELSIIGADNLTNKDLDLSFDDSKEILMLFSTEFMILPIPMHGERWVDYVELNLVPLVTKTAYGKRYKNFKKALEKVLNEKPETCSKLEPILDLPENTKWKDITMKIKETYDVDIRVGNKNYTYNYERMGFGDRRNESDKKIKKTSDWGLLELFSFYNGFFDLDKLIGKEKEKKIKQKQSLIKKLKTLFPAIEGEPIEYDGIKKGYKMKINLIPRKEFRPDFRDRNFKEEDPAFKNIYKDKKDEDGFTAY